MEDKLANKWISSVCCLPIPQKFTHHVHAHRSYKCDNCNLAPYFRVLLTSEFVITTMVAKNIYYCNNCIDPDALALLPEDRDLTGLCSITLESSADDQELPSPRQDIDHYDAHLARTIIPSTAQRLIEQETIWQSINEQQPHQSPPHGPLTVEHPSMSLTKRVKSLVPSHTLSNWSWWLCGSMTKCSHYCMAITSNISCMMWLVCHISSVSLFCNQHWDALVCSPGRPDLQSSTPSWQCWWCVRSVGWRAAMQCDHLVMVLPGSQYFIRLQTTLLYIDCASTPSWPMHLMRSLFFITAVNGISLLVQHIHGKHNNTADVLSRSHLPLIHQQVPSADSRPIPIPPELWQILVLSQPDWTSWSWRNQLACIFQRG